MLMLIFFSIFILYSSDLTITKEKFGKYLSGLTFDPKAKIKNPDLTLAHSLVKSSATFDTSSKSAAWGQLEQKDFDSTASSPFTKFYLKARWILASKKPGIDELARGKELLDEACRQNIADALHFKAMAIKNDIIYNSDADGLRDFDTALACLKSALEQSSSADQKSELAAEIKELEAYLREQELKELAKKERFKAQSPKAQSPKQIFKVLEKTPQDRIKELRKISNLKYEDLLELSGLLVCEGKNKEAFDFLIKSDSSDPRVISKTFDLIEYGSEKQKLLCIAKVTSLIKDSSIDDGLKDSIKERLLEVSKDEASTKIIGAVLKSVLETDGLINAHLVLHQLLTKIKNEDQLLAILQRNQIIIGKEFNCKLSEPSAENISDFNGFKAILDFYLSKKDDERVDEAVVILKESADQGSACSCMAYGKICQENKDFAAALAYYEKATSGIPELSFACFSLLVDRKSSLHDMEKACIHLRRCLDRGDIPDAKRVAVDLYFNHNNPDIQAVVSEDEALSYAHELTTNKDDVIAGRAWFSLGYHWRKETSKKYNQDQDYKLFERRMVNYFQEGAKKDNEDCIMSLAGHYQTIEKFGVSQQILRENILKFKGKRVISAAETVWFENLISLNRCDEAQAYLETSLERKNPILILELLYRKIDSLPIEEIIEKAKEAHQLNNGYSIPRFNIYNDRFTEKLANKIFEIAVSEIVAKKEISSDTFNFMINAIEFGCKTELIEKLIDVLRQINDSRWQELTLKLTARDSEEKGGF